MDYSLAKQLKDAGFSQEGKGEFQFYIGDQRVRDDVGMQADSYYFPTLSELIEACGDKFGALKLIPDDSDVKWWVAMSWDGSDEVDASTPSEAVAKLWLELNKKGNK